MVKNHYLKKLVQKLKTVLKTWKNSKKSNNILEFLLDLHPKIREFSLLVSKNQMVLSLLPVMVPTMLQLWPKPMSVSPWVLPVLMLPRVLVILSFLMITSHPSLLLLNTVETCSTMSENSYNSNWLSTLLLCSLFSSDLSSLRTLHWTLFKCFG